MSKSLRVASVQFNHSAGDKQSNLNTMLGFIQQAAAADCRFICFPECCVTGYWHLKTLGEDEIRQACEKIPDGSTTETLLGWAQELDIAIGAGLLEQDDSGEMFNSYVVVQPDGSVSCHRKLHCFVNEHLSSGTDFTTFQLGEWKAGILICYDNNIIENVRANALLGAEIIIAPHQTGGCNSGSPFAMGVIDRRIWDKRAIHPKAIENELKGDKGRGWLMRWLPARAHDNGVFYIFSNGIGPDVDEVRTGNAMILDPYGRILAETCEADDAIVIAELDSTLRDRCTGVRWMKARRPELYQMLTQSTGNERETRSVRFDHLEEN